MAELERTPEFSGSYSEMVMPDNTATYSARFASPSSAGPNDCVNNLSGNSAVDSYRGPATVPPHSALLVVTGRAGTSQRVVEVLVVSGLNVLADQAITASGNIDMRGRVLVNGWKSLLDVSPVTASLHSNSEEAEARIRYLPGSLPGAEIEISGRLTSSSPSSKAAVFQVGPGVLETKLKTRVPPKALPRPNVQAIVADQVGAPGPPISSAPGPLNFSGNNYYSGDVTINGDVTLDDNAGLYVNGNLTVNGSILGKGKVMVTGDTTFYGEAEVAFREDDYVSLLSAGHVVLKGFKGQQYLDGLTGSGLSVARPPGPPMFFAPERLPNYPPIVELETAWHNLRTAFTHLREDFLEVSPGPEPNLGEFRKDLRENDIPIDILQSIIAYQPNGSTRAGDPSTPVNREFLEGIDITERTHNSAGALRIYMEQQAGGHLSASRFLSERFLLLEDLFRMRGTKRDGSGNGVSDLDIIFTDYPMQWDRTVTAPFDTFQSSTEQLRPPLEEGMRDMLRAIYQFDYDRLGSANFKGIVYSGGAFVATDDVVVRGTVVVNGDPGVGPLEVNLGPGLGSKTFLPGEVGLYGHTTLTYVEELFDDGVHNLAGAGTLDIARWIAR